MPPMVLSIVAGLVVCFMQNGKNPGHGNRAVDRTRSEKSDAALICSNIHSRQRRSLFQKEDSVFQHAVHAKEHA